MLFREVRVITKVNLGKARNRQQRGNDIRLQKWRPFTPGETVYLRRPKKWKLGAKWIGPFEVVCGLGVDYKIKSKEGKITVVHHDHLKV